MKRKRKISGKKKVKIQTSDLFKKTEQGKYFPIRQKDNSRNLVELRPTIDLDSYRDLMQELEKFPNEITHLLTAIKREVHELDSPNLVFSDFDSEFAWAKVNIHRHINEINEYINFSKNYHNKVLIGDFDEANSQLDLIENKFGLSIWLIKNRIALLQQKKGLESQKSYSQKIKVDLRNGSLPRFIIHWISVRNEDQTSITRFVNQLAPILNKLTKITQFGYKEYSRYHLFPSEILEPDEMIQVVRLEYSSSLIDYYESFVVLLRILLSNENEKIRARAENFLKKQSQLKDDRLEVLCAFNGFKHNLNSQKLNILGKISDLFLKGEFLKAYNESRDSISEDPEPVSIILNSYARSFLYATDLETSQKENFILLQESNLIDKILNLLSDVLKNGLVTASEASNELSKLALNFATTPAIDAINFVLSRENHLFSEENQGKSDFSLSFGSIHPIFLESFLSKTCSEKYLELNNTYYANTLSFKIYSAALNLKLNQIPTTVFKEQFDLVAGMMESKLGNYNAAIKHAEKLISSNINYFVRIGYGLISRAHLRNKNYEETCKIIGTCLVSNNNYYPYLPLKELSITIKPGTEIWRKLNKSIELSIILDACVKHFDKKLEINRRFAYEDFLLKNGASKPSDLFTRYETFDSNKLLYYFQFICIESVMDTSGAFTGGSSEVLEERLKICRFILEIQGSNEEVVQMEIRDLVRRKIITSRRQEVDKSRIYVDLQSVKEWAEKELKENFQRYMAYVSSNLERKSAKQNNSEFDNQIVSSTVMDIPEDEVNDLLLYMFEQIRDVYLSSEFGLDRFISTRIRHGELERNIRTPFQTHKLITKREFKNGPYQRNSYWFQKLNIGDRQFQKEFDKAFGNFSESYDTLIANITSDWLQIKKTEKGRGLFNFIIGEQDVLNLSQAISSDCTLRDFIDVVIVRLEAGLILNLVNIREELNSKAKEDAKKLLNTLQEKTAAILPIKNAELQDAINQARIDFQAQFNKVIEWFVPSSSGNSAPFFITDAIIVGEEIIKDANPSFRVNGLSHEDEDENSIPIHGQLPIFVDIFINIFENVEKRSGMETPEAFVTIKQESLTDELTILTISVVNDLGTNINKENLESELLRKKELLKTGNYSQYLAKERNSGLFKIYKSVMHFNAVGFDVKPTVNFGIIDEKYSIEISVPLRIIKLNLEEEPLPND